MKQPQLPTEHDLPPRWNGRVVQWSGWEMPAPIFICPPPRKKECCEQCGSTADQPCNTGLVAHKKSTTLSQIEGTTQAGKPGRYASIRLFAWRCPDCHLDTVSDLELDEVWTLDLTDYGDEGSADPSGNPFAP